MDIQFCYLINFTVEQNIYETTYTYSMMNNMNAFFRVYKRIHTAWQNVEKCNYSSV